MIDWIPCKKVESGVKRLVPVQCTLHYTYKLHCSLRGVCVYHCFPSPLAMVAVGRWYRISLSQLYISADQDICRLMLNDHIVRQLPDWPSSLPQGSTACSIWREAKKRWLKQSSSPIFSIWLTLINGPLLMLSVKKGSHPPISVSKTTCSMLERQDTAGNARH